MFLRNCGLEFQDMVKGCRITCSISFILSEFEEIYCTVNSMLSPSDREYLKGCSRLRKHSYLLGRYALYQSLKKKGKQYFPEVSYGCFGQPFLKEENKKICISHSENLGISINHPPEILLGVDHEFRTDKTDSLVADTICNTQEINLFSSVNLPTELIKLAIWTIKEALSKAIQTGFGVDFEAFEIETLEEISSDLFDIRFKYFKCFKALTWLGKNFSMTLAFPENLDFFSTELIEILRCLDRKEEILG